MITETLMQERTIAINEYCFLLKYYYDGCSFKVKVWQEQTENIDINKPYITFHLRFTGDCVHNMINLLDHFCDKKEMLTLFKLYEYIANSVPWDDFLSDDELIQYCKKEYNFDINNLK
jgi:hypothetical protein